MNFEAIELINEDIKVAWDYIGEGLNGDYNPKDRNDVPLMRLDVFLKSEDGEWIQEESVCSCFTAKARFNEKYKSLIYILFYVKKGLEVGRNLKHMIGELSYISEDTMEEYHVA